MTVSISLNRSSLQLYIKANGQDVVQLSPMLNYSKSSVKLYMTLIVQRSRYTSQIDEETGALSTQHRCENCFFKPLEFEITDGVAHSVCKLIIRRAHKVNDNQPSSLQTSCFIFEQSFLVY